MSLRETVSTVIDLIVLSKGNPSDIILTECGCHDPNCKGKGLSEAAMVEEKYNLHGNAVDIISKETFQNICFLCFYTSITVLAVYKYLNEI